MYWYQRSFGRLVGSALQTVRAISKAASYLSEVILLNHPLKQTAYDALNNFITTYIKAGLCSWSNICESLESYESRCGSFSLSSIIWPADAAGFCCLFSLLFVSLPVFIKLVKSLLQLCQPRIMLRCSHLRALQLPGNWSMTKTCEEAESTFWHKVNIKPCYIKS